MAAAALRKGAKIFTRDFPAHAKRPASRVAGGMRSRSNWPNVSKQKHEIRKRRFLIPENTVFTCVTGQSGFRISAGDLHHAIFSSTMNSPDDAISVRFDPQARQNMKRLPQTMQPLHTYGESCTQPIVGRAFAQYAVLNGSQPTGSFRTAASC